MPSVVKKILGEASKKQGDMRFFIPATVRVWLTTAELQGSVEISSLREMNLPIEEKVRKAKQIAANMAIEKLTAASTDSVYLHAVDDGKVDPDRIDWDTLLGAPAEPEKVKDPQPGAPTS